MASSFISVFDRLSVWVRQARHRRSLTPTSTSTSTSTNTTPVPSSLSVGETDDHPENAEAGAVSDRERIARVLTPLLKDFTQAVDYVAPTFPFVNDELESAMLAEMDRYETRSPFLEKATRYSSTYAELNYPHETFDERLNIALFTAYVIYIDDTAPKKPQAFEEFEYRILHNLPQLDPVLRAFEVSLKRMWDIYDPPCARSIFSSVMQFTVFACIEPTMQQTGELVVGAQRLPWFIRQRSGLGVAYACFTFPKNLNLPFMEYVQAIPDMEYWIDVANDLFSFYKEEIVGEDTNFAHTRARVDHKSAMQVVGEFVEELLTCRSVIHTVLGRHPEILKIWIASENGYIAWHLSQARYRLQEIGLSV